MTTPFHLCRIHTHTLASTPTRTRTHHTQSANKRRNREKRRGAQHGTSPGEPTVHGGQDHRAAAGPTAGPAGQPRLGRLEGSEGRTYVQRLGCVYYREKAITRGHMQTYSSKCLSSGNNSVSIPFAFAFRGGYF